MDQNTTTRACRFRWLPATAYALRALSPIFLSGIVLQIVLIIHCVRTGRNTVWIWVLALLSLPGAIAYIAVEILPSLWRTPMTGRALRGFRRALDPEQQLRNLAVAAQRSGDVANRQRYAEELVRQGRAAQAVTVYGQILTGLYEYDPNLLLGLANAQFAAGLSAAARETLDRLIRRNPNFKSPEGHLLYARALEGEGDLTKALEEYAAVAGYFAGAEATLRHALLLIKVGHLAATRQILSDLLEHARLAPGHYRHAQGEWLTAARRELAAL
jgi:hypothetical protein